MAGKAVASSSNPRYHGSCIDQERKRVQCNYCGHQMSGFHRLKLHLACISGDVRSCPDVPPTVKEVMRNLVGNRGMAKGGRPKGNADQKQDRDISFGSNDNGHDEILLNHRASRAENNKAVELASSSQYSQRSGNEQLENQDLWTAPSTWSDRFFSAPRIGITNAASSYPIQSSMSAAIIGQTTLNVCGADEGAESLRYVGELIESWNETGCSILIDTWTKGGQKFLQFLVDSPMGPVYLQSHDISAYDEEETEAILGLVDQLVDKIGAENVVQIVGSSNSLWDMWALRDVIEQRNSSVFFALSSSQCLEVMLERMEELPLLFRVEDMKDVIDFISSDKSIFELLQNQCEIKKLLMRPFKFRQAKPYMMLEGLVKQKKKLEFIFNSSEWRALALDQTRMGREVEQIIRDPDFWTRASNVLKFTLPIIKALYSMDTSPVPQMGFIYNIVDQMKSQIEKEFENRTSEYDDISLLIDEVWNKDLHSDLHCAAYFLNPCLNSIFVDDEVEIGLSNCITRMIPGDKNQQRVKSEALSCRREGTFFETLTGLSPVDWWLRRGGQFSGALQRMAIRILGQTCDGVSRFQLKRSLTENMLAAGRNPLEQKILSDAIFTRYNLVLKKFKICIDAGVEIEEIDRTS